MREAWEISFEIILLCCLRENLVVSDSNVQAVLIDNGSNLVVQGVSALSHAHFFIGSMHHQFVTQDASAVKRIFPEDHNDNRSEEDWNPCEEVCKASCIGQHAHILLVVGLTVVQKQQKEDVENESKRYQQHQVPESAPLHILGALCHVYTQRNCGNAQKVGSDEHWKSCKNEVNCKDNFGDQSPGNLFVFVFTRQVGGIQIEFGLKTLLLLIVAMITFDMVSIDWIFNSFLFYLLLDTLNRLSQKSEWRG